jgi:hypothetical protein
MQRREVSETAEPQKARLRCVREGRPRARTSVAVSERAQQKDCVDVSDSSRHRMLWLTKSNSLSPLAALVR